MKIHIIHNYPKNQNIVGGMTTHVTHVVEEISKKHDIVETYLADKKLSVANLNADYHILISSWDNCNVFKQADFKNKKVGFFFSEFTEYPEIIRECVGVLDEIWVTTHWHKNIFSNYFKKPIRVVPEGVDPKIFNPNIEKIDIEKEIGIDEKSFYFLSVARPHTRKNLKKVADAFIEEFEGENAKLIMATGCELSLFPHPQIVNVLPTISHAKFAKLYVSCDAFVSATRAEGWGLPICEAMACGLPVIAPIHTGISQYAKEDLVYSVAYKPISYNEANIVNYDGEIDENNSYMGIWADVDKSDLRQKMRYVYENREEAKKVGLDASKHILNGFTWDKMGAVIESLI